LITGYQIGDRMLKKGTNMSLFKPYLTCPCQTLNLQELGQFKVVALFIMICQPKGVDVQKPLLMQ
jgi:hypothetical protein